MAFTESVSVGQLAHRLQCIYGAQGGAYVEPMRRLLLAHLEQCGDATPPNSASRWSERDVVLITYADQIRADGDTPLTTLNQFLSGEALDQLINTVHLLPLYPSSSDDGFSVVDYKAVEPSFGTWEDVRCLRRRHDLMLDLVLNHVSQYHVWFQGYLAGDPDYVDHFIAVDPTVDLSQVIRPRSLPLLTEFETARGTRHVWTTFSADQADLNYGNPAVLLAVIDVLLFYLRQGARFVRLDAIAYLWKEIGTRCIHLPQTHEVVKLMRDIIDMVAPHVILLTETNVPHQENISYFGSGDEAHMVYQFSLPPLLLDAFLQHDAMPFNQWLATLAATADGTTYFNFTASHDGIGVRPLEGLVPPERLAQLVTATTDRGGLVGSRRTADGHELPYELNITYLDALSDTQASDATSGRQRFLASQAIMLALRGIPGVYFHSLVGSRNDLEGVESSGIARRINRHKYSLQELLDRLHDDNSEAAGIYSEYRRLIATRIAQPAFHPDGPQQPLAVADRDTIAFVRTSPDGRQRILVAANVCGHSLSFVPPSDRGFDKTPDLLSNSICRHEGVELAPYQVAWFAAG